MATLTKNLRIASIAAGDEAWFSLSYQPAGVARISSSRESELIVAKLDNQQLWFSIGVMESVKESYAEA